MKKEDLRFSYRKDENGRIINDNYSYFVDSNNKKVLFLRIPIAI